MLECVGLAVCSGRPLHTGLTFSSIMALTAEVRSQLLGALTVMHLTVYTRTRREQQQQTVKHNAAICKKGWCEAVDLAPPPPFRAGEPMSHASRR